MAYATEPVMLELNMLIDEVGLDNRASIEGNEGNRTRSVQESSQSLENSEDNGLGPWLNVLYRCPNLRGQGEAHVNGFSRNDVPDYDAWPLVQTPK